MEFDPVYVTSGIGGYIQQTTSLSFGDGISSRRSTHVQHPFVRDQIEAVDVAVVRRIGGNYHLVWREVVLQSVGRRIVAPN